MTPMNSDGDNLRQKIWNGERLNQRGRLPALEISLEELAHWLTGRRFLAQEKTHEGQGNEIVTYIVDRNGKLYECLQRLL
jgi:hypothetical protein